MKSEIMHFLIIDNFLCIRSHKNDQYLVLKVGFKYRSFKCIFIFLKMLFFIMIKEKSLNIRENVQFIFIYVCFFFLLNS